MTAQAFERAFRKARTLRPAQGRRRAPGCSGSPATPRSTSCGGASAIAALAADPADADAPAPEEAAERALERAAVRAALAGLPPRERELIALKFHAGLDNAELAAVLGVSVSNAGTQLHRAMTKLRRAVDDRS